MRQQESADESLQKAFSKISSITQQYDREVNRRASLEMSIHQLNHYMEQERQEMESRHVEELAKRRDEWEMERDTLLTVIQNDCHSAFEEHWRSRSVGSPHHAPTPSRPSSKGVQEEIHYSSGKKKLTVDTHRDVDLGSSSQSGFNVVSPAYSDIDNVLRETEDLIQSIM